MSVVLIGYRGSGKTTLGRLLATHLSWSFADLDELIVRQTGQSIKTIFEQQGESFFRKLETEHLLEVVGRKNHVISLGGGAILAEQNRKAISAAGHAVIYLKASADELHRRIVADPATAQTRPGLTHLGGSVEEVRRLLELREPLYQAVKTLELDVTDNPQMLVSRLRELLHI